MDNESGTYGLEGDERDERAEEVLLQLTGTADELEDEGSDELPSEVIDRSSAQDGEWIFSEELDKLASSYGISEEDLAKFESEGDLRLAMKMVDRQMVELAQRQQAEQTQQGTTPLQHVAPAQMFQPTFAQQATPEQQPMQMPAALQVELDSLGEDDPLRRGVESIVSFSNAQAERIKAMEDMMVAQQQYQEQQYVQSVLTWFDKKMDGMGSELYGMAGNRSPVQQKNYNEVLQAFAMQLEYARNHGLTDFDWDVAHHRAANGVHGITKKLPQDKQRAAQIRARSARRSAVGRSRGTARPEESSMPRKWSDDPDLMASVQSIMDRG